MKVFLVRHGIKEKIAGDPPLSEIGKQQALNTGIHLKQSTIDKVITSPLLRTRQTAKVICKKLDVDYKVDERLRERMNWGDKKDQTFEDFIEEWVKTNIDRDYVPISGDSSRKTGFRIEAVIKDQIQENSVKNLVLITHGGAIIDFLRNVFTETELNNTYDKFIDNLDSVIKECSVTIVEFNNRKFKLLSLATIDHLVSKNATQTSLTS